MSQRRLALALLLLLAAFALPAVAMLVLGSLVTPEAIEAGTVVLTPPCPDAPCPTCGLTRSWMAMGHLRPLEAWRYHPAGPALYAATWGLVGLLSYMAVHLVRTELLARPEVAS